MAKRYKKAPKLTHDWERVKGEWYSEPRWCSTRLFQVETFSGYIRDPFCGAGRIVDAAVGAGHVAYGHDLHTRPWRQHCAGGVNFFKNPDQADNIVTNCPFSLLQATAERAVEIARRKVALFAPLRRVPAGGGWLGALPLVQLWLLTPRPSLPPGDIALELEKSGREARGGSQEFCWLVFDKGRHGKGGRREWGWLHRDG